ncbi:HAD-IIIC family phosphatase [Pseudaeromonas sp. ZJS20]|uniref:HAD-IIIC family phosphatase n=1 Tax=Pseudaeromonas aegiceratis TaxID=3153928 RepID=UPI00390C835C
MSKVEAVIFDLDNTLVNTKALEGFRKSTPGEAPSEDLLRETKVYPKVRTILREILSKGVKLAIVTNSTKRYAHAILEFHDIKRYFGSIITYNDVSLEGKKPSPNGIEMAMKALNVGKKVLYIGDDEVDFNAAYAAHIKPIAPAWASNNPIKQIPAAMLSSTYLIDELDDYDGIKLLAEFVARNGAFSLPKKRYYFMPMLLNGDVGALKKENIDAVCLGRYFSQGDPLTALLHNKHALSQEIYKKDLHPNYVMPEYFVDLTLFYISKAPKFFYNTDDARFDIVTVIPSKKGKNPRLENMLNRVSKKYPDKATRFISDLFYFEDDARSLKTLGGRDVREAEIKEKLKLKNKYKHEIQGSKVLIIDDVFTTGATLRGAFSLIEHCIPDRIFGVCFAKTVNIKTVDKFCPECGRKMQCRTNRKTGKMFWGCTGYFEKTNQCRHTEDYSQ